jgi:hypothetical protein
MVICERGFLQTVYVLRTHFVLLFEDKDIRLFDIGFVTWSRDEKFGLEGTF